MNFDLNINNYNISELEDIFELPSNYTDTIFNFNETKLRKSIVSNTNIKFDIKPKILAFISDAKERIINKNGTKTDINAGINDKSTKNSISSLTNLYGDIYNVESTLKPSETISDGGTFIIKKPKTPYAQSKPSEFYEGVINPLDSRILKKFLNIDTRFRSNYYTTPSSNFQLDLPLRLYRVVSLELSAIEFPTTFYSISKIFGNNFFAITINNIKQIIIVPDGDYTNKGIQSYLNEKMASYAHNIDPSLRIFQYIYFTIDNIDGNGSGKMIVSINEDYYGREQNSETDLDLDLPFFNFSLEFNTKINGEDDKSTPLPVKLGWLFGFRAGEYINNHIYVSEGVVDLKGLRYIYLVVNDYNNNMYDGFSCAFNSSLLGKNVLARISLQGNLFTNISQTNLSLLTCARQYFGPVDIQKFQIQLLDEYGRILNLNNMDFSFCLSFQTIYDL
jgi:hypothetical protein